jgi:hypothetical protein
MVSRSLGPLVISYLGFLQVRSGDDGQTAYPFEALPTLSDFRPNQQTWQVASPPAANSSKYKSAWSRRPLPLFGASGIRPIRQTAPIPTIRASICQSPDPFVSPSIRSPIHPIRLWASSLQFRIIRILVLFLSSCPSVSWKRQST